MLGQQLTKESILAEARAIMNRKPYSREDSSKVDGLLRMAEVLTPAQTKDELRRAHLENIERELTPEIRAVPGNSEWEQSWYAWLRNPSQENYGVAVRAFLAEREQRTVSYTPQSTTTTEGGYLVPASFTNALLETVKSTDPLYGASTLVQTATGSAFAAPAPILDEYSVEAATLAQNTEGTAAAVVFRGLAWTEAPKWSAKGVLVPIELVQDSAFDIGSVLARIFGLRYARGIGKQFNSTLLSSSLSAFTAVATNAVTGDELVSLVGSVDPYYAARGAFLMNFNTLVKIYTLKGSTSGDYLFPAQTDANGTPLLLGRRVLLSPSMQNMFSQSKAIAYGDPTAFLRREVSGSMQLKAARELYIEKGQYAYWSSFRCDGQLLTSANPSDSSPAFKYITMKT